MARQTKIQIVESQSSEDSIDSAPATDWITLCGQVQVETEKSLRSQASQWFNWTEKKTDYMIKKQNKLMEVHQEEMNKVYQTLIEDYTALHKTLITKSGLYLAHELECHKAFQAFCGVFEEIAGGGFRDGVGGGAGGDMKEIERLVDVEAKTIERFKIDNDSQSNKAKKRGRTSDETLVDSDSEGDSEEGSDGGSASEEEEGDGEEDGE